MDCGLRFSKDLIGMTLGISIVQFIFTIILWATLFTESIILDLIKVVIFFVGCGGACIVQLYNMQDRDSNLKILPVGMMVMIGFSIFAVILIIMHIISKGFMDCVGEFIALAFAIVFLLAWNSLYSITDREVQYKFYSGDSNVEDRRAEQRNAAVDVEAEL